jgi:hypothetical protein
MEVATAETVRPATEDLMPRMAERASVASLIAYE